MKLSRAHAAVVANHTAISRQSRTWIHTVSGITILAVGLQGTDAMGKLSEQSFDESPIANLGNIDLTDTFVEPIDSVVAPKESNLTQPRFSQFRVRVQALISNNSSQSSRLSIIDHLEAHRRQLHRRSNEVELQLLDLQQLLSLQAYGTSFADRLLDEDEAYQSKLQQLQTLEAEMYGTIGQSNTAMFNQFKHQLQLADQELRDIAQNKLKKYIEHTQSTSTLGVWQEPMYLESLTWLMEYTHERHLLKIRQQTLMHTLLANNPEAKCEICTHLDEDIKNNLFDI